MARRININTGSPYKMGDEPTKLDLPLREGLVFSRYGDRKYKKTDATKGYREGYFHERWISHDAYEALKKKASSRSLEHQRRHRGKGKKQVNPSTGEPWKTGELNSKGQYFWKHSGYVRNDGYFSLLWADNHKEYLKLSRVYHPDKSDNQEYFKALNEIKDLNNPRSVKHDETWQK